MRRREFIALLGSAAAWPLAARAQQEDKIARLGWLAASLDNPVQALGREVLTSSLRRLGFSEGHNLVIEHRPTDEGIPKAFAGANELVAAKADVLLADGPELALQAATAARPVVPVVMLANNYDPFERGYVKTLAQPGGNVTGMFYRQQELAAKQLELLSEAFPDRKHVGVLWDHVSDDTFRSAARAASAMGLSLGSVKLESPPYDFEVGFRTLAEAKSQAVLVLSSPLFTPRRFQIAELAIRHGLPTMFIFRTYVDAGGLMSYGVDPAVMYQRAGSSCAERSPRICPSNRPGIFNSR